MPNGNGNGIPPPPTPDWWQYLNIPPELIPLLAPLLGVIVSGVTRVSYADRTIQYASIPDLLKLFGSLPGMVGAGGPRRRYGCFSKGLDGSCAYLEHVEIRDVLFSREVPASPLRTVDVDWERAR